MEVSWCEDYVGCLTISKTAVPGWVRRVYRPRVGQTCSSHPTNNSVSNDASYNRPNMAPNMGPINIVRNRVSHYSPHPPQNYGEISPIRSYLG